MIKRLLYTLIVMIAAAPLATAGDYTINITHGDGGSVGVSKLSGTADADELIKVFIHPDNDLWKLESLSIVRADNNAPIDYAPYHDPNYEAYSFTMPASNVNITASFVRALYYIDISNPDEGGYATADVTKAATGDEVTITANPLYGYRTNGLSAVNIASVTPVDVTTVSENVFKFTIGTDDVVVTPLFDPLPVVNINLLATENGTYDVDDKSYAGEEIFIYTTPDRGYSTDEVTVTSYTSETESMAVEVTKLSDDSYSFITPECSWINVSVTFDKTKYTVGYDTNIEHGTVAEDPASAFHHFDDVVTLRVTPDADYKLAHLYILDDDENEIAYDWQTEGETLTFTMPYNNVKVFATFRYTVYDIEILASELGTVTADKASARVGDVVTLTVTPDKGCMLTDIKVLAGYEVTGGGGSVHAPSLKSEGLWYTQMEIYLRHVDANHYSFELPVDFYNDLSPNYMENTKFRVLATFKDVGAQVMWCADNNTLYFNYEAAPQYEPRVGDRYDDQIITAVWLADDVLKTGWSSPKWLGVAGSSAKRVVFSPSFVEAAPTSTYSWFLTFRSLETIEGIENLNTSSVTNTNSMFMGCVLLKTLNLNTFDMSHVTNSTSMFRACSELTTIYCDSTWNINASEYMFTGDTKLVGAVAYDAAKVGGEMANPDTGYFTSSLPITKSVTGNGTITAPESAFANETVSFTVEAGLFSRLESVTVTGDATGDVIATTLIDGVYSFTMPAEPVTINATFPEPPSTVEAVLWCEGNTTLYFVRQPVENVVGGQWDGQEITAVWWGNEVLNVGWSVPRWNSLNEAVTRVVIDESFGAARPQSCYGWFYRFVNLDTIEGLANLNTSEVTNTNSMFLKCSKLTTLDVNTFDVSHVTNASGMFRESGALTTIYCNNTWNIGTTSSMFFADSCLVGAVSYDMTLDDGQMANPLTGYFTALSAINIVENPLGTVTCDVDQAYTNTVVILHANANNERIMMAELKVVGDVTGKIYSVERNNGGYSFVMPGESVTVSVVFRQMEYLLTEALQESVGAELRVVSPLHVAAMVGTHAYVTDGQNCWARFDLAETDRVREGDDIVYFDGVLTNRDIAPAFVYQEDGAIAFEHDGEAVELREIDLANEFEMPQPSEVIEVSGYYKDGALFGKRNGKGISMTLATDYSQPEMTEGNHYRLLVGVELKEPWSAPSGAPQRSLSDYENEYQNLKGQIVRVLEEEVVTGIEDIDTDSQFPHDGRRYNLMGQPVGPDYKGVVIENGRKILVK